jgi:enoyl-CoA hydratase
MSELRVEIEDGVALVTMDNPPVNASSQEWDFQGTFDSFYYNTDVRVAVLTGDGTRSFCAGADVKRRAADVQEAQAGGGSGGNTAYISGQRRGRENFNCIMESAVPVIGAINGYCLGMGMALAGSCDYLIASETASFGLPEINVGLLGGARHMMRAFPQNVVRRAHYTGERVSAQDAYHFGAVWKLAPPDQLMEVVMEEARLIASKMPIGIRLAKENLLAIEEMDVRNGYRWEQTRTRILQETDDALEAKRAFAEKRQPVYHGR